MNDHHIGNEETRAKSANRVTWAGFLVNVMLTFFKLVAGLIGHSGAMIADAIHSLSDFVTDLVVLASFRMVRKPADKDHDYGHGKFETLASVFIGVALLVVGVGIFTRVRKRFIQPWYCGLRWRPRVGLPWWRPGSPSLPRSGYTGILRLPPKE